MAARIPGAHRTFGEAARSADAQRNQHPVAALESPRGSTARGTHATQGTHDIRQETAAAQGKAVTSARIFATLAAASRCTTGCSERDMVWQSGKLTLFRYRAIARPAAAAPVLIVYALVN